MNDRPEFGAVVTEEDDGASGLGVEGGGSVLDAILYDGGDLGGGEGGGACEGVVGTTGRDG